MNYFLAFLAMVMLISESVAQPSSKRDYIIVQDTVSIQGAIQFDRSLPAKVVMYTGEGDLSYFDSDILTFHAGEISGFGMKKQHFVSREVRTEGQLEKIFLEVVSFGRNLFLVHPAGDRFFIESEAGLAELSRETYRQQLNGLNTDCTNWSDMVCNVQYKRKSLKYIFDQAEGGCGTQVDYGLGFLAGYGTGSMAVDGHIGSFDNHDINAPAFLSGIEFRIPIWEMPRVYGELELFYIYFSFAEELRSGEDYYDLIAESSSVALNARFVYLLRNKGIVPFISGGVTSRAYFAQKSEYFYYHVTNGEMTVIHREDEFSVDPMAFGFVVSGGVQFPVFKQHLLSLEYTTDIFFATNTPYYSGIVLKFNL